MSTLSDEQLSRISQIFKKEGLITDKPPKQSCVRKQTRKKEASTSTTMPVEQEAKSMLGPGQAMISDGALEKKPEQKLEHKPRAKKQQPVGALVEMGKLSDVVVSVIKGLKESGGLSMAGSAQKRKKPWSAEKLLAYRTFRKTHMQANPKASLAQVNKAFSEAQPQWKATHQSGSSGKK